jgi:hypothetical protein
VALLGFQQAQGSWPDADSNAASLLLIEKLNDIVHAQMEAMAAASCRGGCELPEFLGKAAPSSSAKMSPDVAEK